jgi:hypothetical protein
MGDGGRGRRAGLLGAGLGGVGRAAGQQGRAGAWGAVIFISFFKVPQVAILHLLIAFINPK